MKARLISVGRLPWYRPGGPLHFFYTPRMGLPGLAAVTPPEWDVDILDGIEVDAIDFDDPVDLVGFSMLTPFARDTYRAAAEYRRRGVTVVMGGVHATLMPEEAKQHADSVVVGEGEEIWPRVLRDAAHRLLRPSYVQDTPVRFDALPSPLYSAIRNGDDTAPHGIPLVRGCPHGRHCPFCTVPRLFGTQYRVQPLPLVQERIRQCAGTGEPVGINVSACCALNHTPYARSFAEAIRPLQVRWSGGGLLHCLNDELLLRSFRQAGCECIYTESAVASPRKDPARYAVYRDAVRKIHDQGMTVSYNFTVGFDDDTREVFDEVRSFIDATHLQPTLCAIQLFVPWPGTESFQTLESAGRILDRNWSHYDNTQVVFVPLSMSPEELGALQRPRGSAGPERGSMKGEAPCPIP